MNEAEIFHHINEMATEEERLYESAGDGSGLSEAEQERLRAIQVELDRCYDVLHQRQARRAAGQDPDEAQARPARTVEGHEQ